MKSHMNKDDTSVLLCPWEGDPALSPREAFEVEEMLMEMLGDVYSPYTISDATGAFALVLSGEQTETKKHIANALHTVLHFSKYAARTAIAAAPCALLRGVHASVADKLATKLSMQGVHVKIFVNAMIDSEKAISGSRLLILQRQDPQKTRLALTREMGFPLPLANHIAKSLPCVVATAIRPYTAKSFKLLFDQAGIVCSIGYDETRGE